MPDYGSYRSTAYDPLEEKYAKQYGIPVDLLRSIRLSGERSNANQVSTAGAKTVYQFTPQTRAGYMRQHGFDPWASPDNATRAAAMHLAGDWKRSKGDVNETIMSYIAGPSGRGRGPQTRAYLQRVTRGMRPLQGSKPSMPSAPSAAQVSGGTGVEDDEEEGTGLTVPGMGAMNSLSVGGKGPNPLDTMFGEQKQSLAKLYGDATERLKSRYAGPDTGDLLLALGAGLLKPTDSGSFFESFGNAANAFGQWGTAKREASNTLEDKLMAMQLAQAKEMNDLQQKYIAARYKTPTADIGANPITGELYNKRTGFLVPGSGEIGILLQDPSPEAIGEFNSEYGPGAAETILAQYGVGGG